MVTTYPFSVSVVVVLYIIPDTPLSQVYNKLYMFKTAIRSMKKNFASYSWLQTLRRTQAISFSEGK